MNGERGSDLLKCCWLRRRCKVQSEWKSGIKLGSRLGRRSASLLDCCWLDRFIGCWKSCVLGLTFEYENVDLLGV
jgi:hypothetical protein